MVILVALLPSGEFATLDVDGNLVTFFQWVSS